MKWKVEEMRLMNDDKRWVGETNIYTFENISKEEKIEFLDNFYDGKVTKMLNLVNKFEQDKDSLPKDKYGYVKTISLKAWIKRNDTDKLTKDYSLGRFCIGDRDITEFNRRGGYEYYGDGIDQIFHNKLKELEREEIRYFESIDEYSVLKKELRKRVEEVDYFNLNLMFCSDGTISIPKDNSLDFKREIEINEIKEILEKYKEVENFINNMNVKVEY